jgi:hypothetical protein
MTRIAALCSLEAVENQLTWRYSREESSQNDTEVIRPVLSWAYAFYQRRCCSNGPFAAFRCLSLH